MSNLKQQSTQDKDTILTVNVVEPGLVRAVRLRSDDLGRPLKGVALVHQDYADIPGRPRDDSGLFTEIICDFNNPNDLQRVLKPYNGTILAATCRIEESVQPFSRLIPFLPYNHTPSETAMFWSTEKPLMRDRLRNYDENLVPKYQYMEISDVDRVEKLIKGFEFPLIIKPTGLSKAMLVSRNETMAELRKNLERTFAAIDDIYQKQQYPGKPGVLIEEMMHGDMYSVDAYVSHDGKIWCLPPVKVVTAHAVGLDGFYGYEQSLPSGLDGEELAGAEKASEDAIKALSLSATTTHIEMFRTKQGWKIIEIAARIGGLRDTLYRKAYGIEHFLNDLRIHEGLEPEIPRKLLKHAVAINIFAESEGRIVSVKGVEEAQKLESVAELDIKIRAGELAIFATEGGNAIVRGVLSNKDPKQLEKDLKRVRELVDISVRPSQQLAIRRAGTPQASQNARVLK